MMDGSYHGTIRHDVIPLIPKGRSILDVGGGTGATVKYLKKIGKADKIGVLDAVVAKDDADLDFASNIDLNNKQELAEFLSEHGPFDAILLLDILEHLVDPWSVVDTFVPYLASGGHIIASVPNVRHVKVSIPLLFGDSWTYSDSGLLDRTHLRFFVKKTAIELIARPNLVIEQVKPSPINGRSHKILNALTLGFFRSFFTMQYLIVAKIKS